MKRTASQIILLAGLIILAGSLLAPFKLSLARWEPKQVNVPLDLYNHNKHFARFGQYGVNCSLCHKTPDSYNREKVDRMGCHYCHNNGQSPAPKAARFKCITCHKDLSQIKPDNHRLNWVDRHQTTAKSDKNYCYKCHKSYFCIDCHQKRDFVEKRMHTRNFRYYHSIVVRSNPRTCSNCHQRNFCKNCHASNN